MDPYYGTTDDGTDLYGSPGAFTDENGVSLGISSGTSVTLADGSFTSTGSPVLNPTMGAPSSGSSTSWLSGLGSLFGAIGTTFTNVTRATAPTGKTINPQTGLPYGINPQTGQPYAISSSSQNTFLLIAVVFVVGWVVFKR
jgi:hypothetical protein